MGVAEIMHGRETITEIPVFYDQAKQYDFSGQCLFNDVCVVLL